MGKGISVVTPSFGQLELLKLAAASVADQPGEVEHIIQDGGSGDGFDAWARGQRFARCYREADDGMYDAINRGFRRAGGGILCWLNCDEQYLPGALSVVSGWFERHPGHDILFGDVVLVDPGGLPLSYRKAIVPDAKHIRRCFLPTYSAATFVRRRVIDEGHWLDSSFRAIADAVWVADLLDSGFRAGVVNEPLAVFTQTGGNLGQSETGRAEARRWRCGPRWPARWSSCLHRARKMWAGCYRKREVSIRVYLGCGEDRVERSAVVGERWRTLG